MKNNKIRVGQAQASWNASGTRILKYTVEMYHEGLNEHKLISAPDIEMLQNKVNLQANKWNEKWDIVESKREVREEKEASIDEANNRTLEAITAIKVIDDLLIHTLSIDDTIDWESLKRREGFSEKQPTKPTPETKRTYPEMPVKEQPKFNIIDMIFKSKKEKKIQEYENKYNAKIADWENSKKNMDELNSQAEQRDNEKLKKWTDDCIKWEERKSTFLKEQLTYNSNVDELKKSYFSLDPDSVLEYCGMVLENSQYPDSFPKSYEYEYNSETKILIIEYQLPAVECLPTVKEVKYIASKKELKETFIPESQLVKMFDDSIYKITLRTIHELFEADKANALEAISFNGWVRAINKATGNEENNCILSIQVKKNEFMTIDLSNVEPKTCFKSLKGVASSKLSSLTPIQPILQLSKVDKRFVEGYDVTNQIDNSTNIAAMDWEDFEHLVRELFEKEFQSNGGEVKVTQASRDGGVDAIAFDPDPIRGGKIVIQAKRYTNTVGVSAVRDLYGTLLNEGANKGILVSTADYGPDAYEFAKGKPITLLNGSNLLHLLEKHGHHAKIDLREAKKILAENEKK